VFTNLKTGAGADTVVRFVVERGMIALTSPLEASVAVSP
jgi:hypothetical protein